MSKSLHETVFKTSTSSFALFWLIRTSEPLFTCLSDRLPFRKGTRDRIQWIGAGGGCTSTSPVFTPSEYPQTKNNEHVCPMGCHTRNFTHYYLRSDSWIMSEYRQRQLHWCDSPRGIHSPSVFDRGKSIFSTGDTQLESYEQRLREK